MASIDKTYVKDEEERVLLASSCGGVFCRGCHHGESLLGHDHGYD
jgi:hypothetical protein